MLTAMMTEMLIRLGCGSGLGHFHPYRESWRSKGKGRVRARTNGVRTYDRVEQIRVECRALGGVSRGGSGARDGRFFFRKQRKTETRPVEVNSHVSRRIRRRVALRTRRFHPPCCETELRVARYQTKKESPNPQLTWVNAEVILLPACSPIDHFFNEIIAKVDDRRIRGDLWVYSFLPLPIT
eukprot:1176389-Prorocentrum_minimum.AAC.2